MSRDVDVEIVENNAGRVRSEVNRSIINALQMIGIKAEGYAKARCPVGTPESTGKKGYIGGTLRNSITYSVNQSDFSVSIGSNVEYAPYVELGTGPYFNSPPEWLQYTTQKGSGIGTGYVRPRPYLKPAIMDHISEYRRILEDQLSSLD